MATRDVGRYADDPDGMRDGIELVDTLRDSILAAWGSIGGVLKDVAGTNTITAGVEIELGFTALSHGLIVVIKPVNTNTGAATLELNSLGAKSVFNSAGQGLGAGELVLGTNYILVFDSNNDHWWISGSSGITNVTIPSGTTIKRSEKSVLVSETGPFTVETSLVSRNFQCTYSTSRVIIEGQLSRSHGTGTLDLDGVTISLYKDAALIATIDAAASSDQVLETNFYFSHLPEDTDSHSYEIKATSTIEATYVADSTYIYATEMSPN